MIDQVKEMSEKKYNGSISDKRHHTDMFKVIKDGNLDVLFVSPEMLRTKSLDLITNLLGQISVLVFDECNCISEWGLDFRPEYRKVSDLVSLFADIPTLLLTATTTKSVQKDIYNLLGLDNTNTKVVAKVPDRPNVYLHMEKPPVAQNIEKKLDWIVNMILKLKADCPKTGIYCENIKQCNTVYGWLMEELEDTAYTADKNSMVEMYHSRTDDKTMNKIINEFKTCKSYIRVICGTVAFGLGINVTDIQLIVNWGLPPSLMTYWQEIGRCARDGSPGFVITYPYTRSVTSCPDKRIKKLVSESGCIRKIILEVFIMEDGDEVKVPSKCENNDCEVCECPMCKCCVNCKSECKCEGKKEENVVTVYQRKI